jgi:hypothetical protein
MSKDIITFTPRNFGGYTFFLILPGYFLAGSSFQYWGNFIVSIICFILALYFYAEDNK